MSFSDRAPVRATACGKLILCGEHAVVYGRPAIALPVTTVRTTVKIEARGETPPRIEIQAPNIKSHFYADTDPGRPLSRIVCNTYEWCRRLNPAIPAQNIVVTVTSDMPVGSHLGTGAAASVASARAVAAWLEINLPVADASALAFEVEKIHHGTPSGIDNTVIAYEQPLWFIKDVVSELLEAPQQTEDLLSCLVVAAVGFSTTTKQMVDVVREGFRANRLRFNQYFDDIGFVSVRAREALLAANWPVIGQLMDENHQLLQELNVSCKELDALCIAARKSGALGAKLSGAGRGGNIIALARSSAHAAELRESLLSSGAMQVLIG